MAAAFAHQWDPRGHQVGHSQTHGQDQRRLGRGLPALLLAAFLTFSLVLLPEASRPALAAEPGPADAQVVPQGPLKFDDCVRLAIQRSPYLIKSAVDIDIRRIDENDSRYTIAPPPMTFRTYYYVDRPQQFGGNPKPYSLSFTMDSYNPFGSYFTLQAQKAATQMAIFAHLHVISVGLERLGLMFLQMATLKQSVAFQTNLVQLVRENLTYAENRRTIGTGTSLEVRTAAQELEVAKSEQARLETSRKHILNSLKNFMGFKPGQSLDLDLRDAPRQVLGSFDPAAATLEQAKERSVELKGLELKKEMQGYMVTVAKVKILPSLLFNAQTPDPLSASNGTGLYVGFGLELPVWDGFKRIRNVSRQKAILKQIGTEKDLKELDLADKWNDLHETINSAVAGLKLARSQEELTRLRERQAEIRYNSGSDQLNAWLEARKSTISAQKNTMIKTTEYDQLILNLRQLCGDLGVSYVDQKSWQK
jgi:outer membrane protein TolC